LSPVETNVRAAQPSSQREELLEAIAREEARLAQLEAEQAEARSRLAAFQAELAAVGAEEEIRVRPRPAAEWPVPKTPAAKVKLLRFLFRGGRMCSRLATKDRQRAMPSSGGAIPQLTNSRYLALGLTKCFRRTPLRQNAQFQLSSVALRALTMLTMLTIFPGPVKPISPRLRVCLGGPHD